MVIDGRIHTREHSVTVGKDLTFHAWLNREPSVGDMVIVLLAREAGEKGPSRIGQFKLVSVAPYQGSYLGKVEFVGSVMA